MATKKTKSTSAVQTATNVLENLMDNLPKATPAPKGKVAKWRLDFTPTEEAAFARWIEKPSLFLMSIRLFSLRYSGIHIFICIKIP